MTPKSVYVITERIIDGQRRTFWTTVGKAYENANGSITLKLDALPLSGTLQIRDDARTDDRPGIDVEEVTHV